MASITYMKHVEEVIRSYYEGLPFKIMLVTSDYTPNKDTDEFRSSVTNEVTGDGYTAGGVVVTATVTVDTANDRVEIEFSDPEWDPASLSADAAVIYISTGNAATDPVVSYVDFGETVTSTNAPFQVTLTSPLRYTVS
jgi:hypothetical protein